MQNGLKRQEVKGFPIAILLLVGFVVWAFWALRGRDSALVPPPGLIPGGKPPPVVVAPPLKKEPAEEQPPFPILVDDFEIGHTQGLYAQRKNRLDAFQGTWAKRPSYTVITKVPDTRPGRGGQALRIEYFASGGWCGWYTLLNGIDISRHNALTFWVRGEKGGERFDIGMADDRMQEIEIDAVYVGTIKTFLPQGVKTQWQKVKVPLASLRSELDLTRMGSLVFWFRYEGGGAVEVDDISFTFDPEVQRIQEENAPRAKKNPHAPRASWVWKYDPVSNLRVRQELLDFCERTGIETLYIYFGEEPPTETPPEFQKGLAEFLALAHAHGIQVQALQGNPLWALKPSHPLVLKWVKGYLDFNRAQPDNRRIDGVHLDIEPYLTPQWETDDRQRIKEQFLDLMRQLRDLIDTQKGDHPFELGLAIPVFYNREPDFEEGLLKQADYAALMDYYDTGLDIVTQGRFHVDLAKRAGKRLVIGVETQDLVRMGQGKRRNTFHEEGWQEMEEALAQVTEAFAKESSFAGIAIHAYDSYRLLQKGRNVPLKERSDKVPRLTAGQAAHPITVDGSLSEWANVSWISIEKSSQVVYGAGAWNGPRDLSCRVALQWQPDALLMAVDVVDNQVIQERRGADMWEGDHLEVWVDADLMADYNEAVNSSDDFQWGFSPGNFNGLAPEVHVWVPSVDPRDLKAVQIAAQKTPSGYALEVRLPASAMRSQGKFKAGYRLGLMVDGSDCDDTQHPQKCMLSTSPQRQWGDPTTFNILELK